VALFIIRQIYTQFARAQVAIDMTCTIYLLTVGGIMAVSLFA